LFAFHVKRVIAVQSSYLFQVQGETVVFQSAMTLQEDHSELLGARFLSVSRFVSRETGVLSTLPLLCMGLFSQN